MIISTYDSNSFNNYVYISKIVYYDLLFLLIFILYLLAKSVYDFLIRFNYFNSYEIIKLYLLCFNKYFFKWNKIIYKNE